MMIDKKPRLDAEVEADAEGNGPTTPKPKSKPTPKSKYRPKKDEFDSPPSTTKNAARLPSSAKRMIAEEIINQGAGSIDVERMASVVSRFLAGLWFW